jgi:DNA repair photolyase
VRATRPGAPEDVSEAASGARDMPLEAFAGGVGGAEGPVPRVKTVDIKSALSPSGLPGLKWSLNPYRGCAHGCAYCYAPSVLRVGREAFSAAIEVRRNIAAVLARELDRRERGVVGLATVTDPYQPLEARFQLSRMCLEQLAQHGWPVSVLTKSDLVARDLDVLGRMPDAEVGFTITTLDEHVRRLLEPGSPPVARRLAGMRLVADAGVRAYAFIGPVYPTASPQDVRALVRAVQGAGASSVMLDRLNLRPGVWPSVERALSADAPLQSLARRRLFPRQEDPDFYGKVFAAAEEEARSLGLGFSKAF